MEKEQPNRIRPGGAAEWKRFRSLPPAEREQARAQRAAEEQEQTESSAEEMKRAYVFKLLALLVLAGALVTFTTIAWFTMNKETGSSGMGVKVQAVPYTIQTRGGSGYYSGTYASLGTDGMEWRISSSKNFDNHEDAKQSEEAEPGIEPGDHGILEFRVNPNNADSITVDCIFDMTAYIETIPLDGSGDPVTVVTEIDDSVLLGYLKAHIMLFSGLEGGKYTGLIDNDASLRRVLEKQTYTRNGETYTQIYWVWPLHLSDITSHNAEIVIFAASERSDVIDYIARNRNGFFKDCGDNESKVKADLTSLATEYSSTIYNHYNVKYDNADLEIGNNVSYVMLSMQVED